MKENAREYYVRVKAMYEYHVKNLIKIRDEIEKTLMEAKIESDTDAFLDQARERAEIVTLNPV